MRTNLIKAALCVVVSVASYSTIAWAFTATGKVGAIHVYRTFTYDQFRLDGSPDICPTADAGFRHLVRFYKADIGYETVMKALMAARLSGADVTVTATTSSGRCVLDQLDIAEP